jgi:hypothetical protein
MSVISTDTQRYSNVVKREFEPEWGYCKKVVAMYDAAATIKLGTVLGAYLDTPVGTAGATVGTGNGVMGAITLTSNAAMVVGTYTLKIVKTVANAGDFVLRDPNGKVIGNGQVAVAFNQAGFAFTLADDTTDFVVGDSIPIVVTGMVKYKLVEATAVNGSEVAKVVVVGNYLGMPKSTTLAANTSTNFLVLYRGPCAVADTSLFYGASINTTPEITAMQAQLVVAGIDVLTTL